MNATLLAVTLFLLYVPFAAAEKVANSSSPVLAVEHYKLAFSLDFPTHSLTSNAEIRVKNIADHAVTRIPVLLYRLMEVSSLTDAQGKPLPFAQKVVVFSDESNYQVNYVEVMLPTPLAPAATTSFRLKYAGALFGYPEVMQYVRDTISEDYSLIRTETMAYPVVAAPSHAGIRQFYKSKFDYEAEITVPASYAAVCSGNDAGKTDAPDGRATYRCISDPGSDEVDVAVAKFQVFEDPRDHLRVYAMPADAAAGNKVMTEMQRALDYYTAYLGTRACLRYRGCSGPSAASSGLTMIEIPNGWGSFAVGGQIFQAAATFKDLTRANEIYHEVAHLWNANASDTIQRARWMDEAFATYFEARAAGELQSPEAFNKQMEASRESFGELVKRDPRGATTPIAEYGKYELGDFAYSKGAWSLHVLHEILGEETFHKSISKFLSDYAERPADFNDFLNSMQKTSGKDLHPWFQQWILSAQESSDLVLKGATVEEMAARCQSRSTSIETPR